MNQHTRPHSTPIPFIDVAAQRRRLGTRIDDAINRVTEHCQFILGPEVTALEGEVAAYHGVPFAAGVASGTDALLLALRVQHPQVELEVLHLLFLLRSRS